MFLNGRAAGGFGRPDEVYSVFGKSKRKLDFEEESFQQHGMEAQTDLQTAKRQRLAPQEDQWGAPIHGDDVPMNELLDQEINHNLPPQSQVNMDPYQLHALVSMEEYAQQHFAALAQQQFAAQAQQPQALPQVPQRDSMPMNINDETYSCYNPEMEEMAMDSDGVPDPQQYKTEKLIFPCGDNCIGGEHSPTTGRVKCYCRPSWEGMIGVVPYFSDYY